ncbi:hypothetical protein NADE_006899 [Nannochloris sp. 'desiccata']|nr:hypothetical protein NADE_006899 [Chlorella desiccata (nom. nud.)]
MWRGAVYQVSKKVPWKSAARHQSPPVLGCAWQTQSFTTQEEQQTTQNNPPLSSTTTTVNGTEIPNDNTPNRPSDVPYPTDPYEDIRQFQRFTDIYLGGLWNRIESELGKKKGAEFEYDVQLTSGCMRVKLPDDAQVLICKDPQEQELKVESNLHVIYGGGDGSGGSEEGADPREEASFKFIEEQGDFMTTDAGGGIPLHQFLEDHLARHLNVELDLEPQPGPHDKVYGSDPT